MFIQINGACVVVVTLLFVDDVGNVVTEGIVIYIRHIRPIALNLPNDFFNSFE